MQGQFHIVHGVVISINAPSPYDTSSLFEPAPSNQSPLSIEASPAKIATQISRSKNLCPEQKRQSPPRRRFEDGRRAPARGTFGASGTAKQISGLKDWNVHGIMAPVRLGGCSSCHPTLDAGSSTMEKGGPSVSIPGAGSLQECMAVRSRCAWPTLCVCPGPGDDGRV